MKDVAILQVGSLTERLAAMETKRVQATVLAPPAMYQAQMRGFNMLADIAALGLPYQAPASRRHENSFVSGQMLYAAISKPISKPCIVSRSTAKPR